jgi:hypothetical protein
MYGRAEFDLLKLRVLDQSKKIQERNNKYKHSQAQPVDRLKKPRRMKNGTTLSASSCHLPHGLLRARRLAVFLWIEQLADCARYDAEVQSRKMTEEESMANDVPQHFESAFLHWFQERTEQTWQNYQTRTLESFVAARVGGSDWQQGTRWLGGLDEQEIARIEQRYQVRFPPDYRLFLQLLHSVDRPMVGAGFARDTTMVARTRHHATIGKRIPRLFRRPMSGLFRGWFSLSSGRTCGYQVGVQNPAR